MASGGIKAIRPAQGAAHSPPAPASHTTAERLAGPLTRRTSKRAGRRRRRAFTRGVVVGEAPSPAVGRGFSGGSDPEAQRAWPTPLARLRPLAPRFRPFPARPPPRSY